MAELDGPRFVVREEVVLRKYEGDWTHEQIDAGEADHAVLEELVVVDGVIVSQWRRDGQDQG